MSNDQNKSNKDEISGRLILTKQEVITGKDMLDKLEARFEIINRFMIKALSTRSPRALVSLITSFAIEIFELEVAFFCIYNEKHKHITVISSTHISKRINRIKTTKEFFDSIQKESLLEQDAPLLKLLSEAGIHLAAAIVAPMHFENETNALLLCGNTVEKQHYFEPIHRKILSSYKLFCQLSSQALKLIQINHKLYEANKKLRTLITAYKNFVPAEFMKMLHKRSVIYLNLGDCVEIDVTIMFTDIRDYTTILEKKNPTEAFYFINKYFKAMGPIVRKHHGFINQYQGDAIMALFPRSPEDAMNAVFEMSQSLIIYNEREIEAHNPPLKVGYGLNTGKAMLGTIGEEERMDANVISDAVNLASRVEALNKEYGTKCLISEMTYNAIADKTPYIFRLIDKVRVKGKEQAIYLYKVYLSGKVDEKEKQFINQYEKAFRVYEIGNVKKAKELFSACHTENLEDHTVSIFIKRCTKLIERGLPTNWDGAYDLHHK